MPKYQIPLLALTTVLFLFPLQISAQTSNAMIIEDVYRKTSTHEVPQEERLQNKNAFVKQHLALLEQRYGESLTTLFLLECYDNSSQIGNKLAQYASGKMPCGREEIVKLCLDLEKTYPSETSDWFRERSLEWIQTLDDEAYRYEFSELDLLGSLLPTPFQRKHYYFQVYKTLSYYNDFAELHTSKYLKNRCAIIKLASKVAQVCNNQPINALPHYPDKRSTRFIFDPFDCNKKETWGENECLPFQPFAVIKVNETWNREEFAWEAAQLFQIESSFMPTISAALYEEITAIQPYWNFVMLNWPKNRVGETGGVYRFENLVKKFSTRRYWNCCLGALLFSLYDQSIYNTRYKQLKDGSLAIINFDNDAMLPCYNRVWAEFNSVEDEAPIRVPRSLWAWYFDFPQAEIPLSGSDEIFVKKLTAKWQDAFRSFKDLYNHPLNNFYQGAPEAWQSAMQERLNHIVSHVEAAQGDLTIKEVLFGILPEYAILIENIEKHLPESRGAALSTLWCVNMTLDQLRTWLLVNLKMAPKDVEDFMDWYVRFGKSLPGILVRP